MGDPAAKVPGYKWFCCNCSAAPLRAWWTMKLVKTFINPSMPMPAMGKTATIYCASCPKGQRLYCTGCAGRLHNVGTKTQHHSLEAIDPHQSRSLFYLAPVFDVLLVPVCVLITVMTVGLPSGYMSGRDVCPTTHFVRSRMYHFDSGLTFLLKDKLALTCNLEDGYFRLIIDAWVRGISTNSDNLLLLYSAIVRSLVFHTIAIRLILMPILVVANSLLSGALHVLVSMLSYFGLEAYGSLPSGLRNKLSSFAVRLQSWADLVAFKLQWWKPLHSMFLPKMVMAAFPAAWYTAATPPPTLARLRPRTDYMDAYKYWKDRQFRMWEFFYDAAKNRLEVLAAVVPVGAVILRVLCITTSLGWYIRRMLLMPGDVAASADVPGDALGYAIDKLVRALVPMAVSYVPVSTIICATLVYIIYRYPKFKNMLDTRNMYGAACSKAPVTVTTGKCRFFPQTFEPEAAAPPAR